MYLVDGQNSGGIVREKIQVYAETCVLQLLDSGAGSGFFL